MIEIRKGDLTDPIWKDTHQVIIHCCNDVGEMAAGVAYALMKKWPVVREKYKSWYTYNAASMRLGEVQFVIVEPTVEVANLIGQKGIGRTEFVNVGYSMAPIRYEALFEGFVRIRNEIKGRFTPGNKWTEYTFHLPMLGSKLAGGDFYKVYEQYIKAFEGTNSRTCFYAFSDEDFKLLQEVQEHYGVLAG